MNDQTILLVDNSKSFQSIIQEFLELRGYRVLVASGPKEANEILGKEAIALIVIDVRLMNDEDEMDESGLTFAKQIDPSIPKIMLTAFPTYQAVRKVLAPSSEGIEPNAIVVAKQEGLSEVLPPIQVALAQFEPEFEERLLGVFHASALIKLRGQMEAIGASESLDRIRAIMLEQNEKSAQQCDGEERRISNLHHSGLFARSIGMLLIGATVISVMAGVMEIPQGASLSVIAGLITKAVNDLFSRQEAQAHKRLKKLRSRQEKTDNERRLIESVELHGNPEDRAEAMKRVHDYLLQQCLSKVTD